MSDMGIYQHPRLTAGKDLVEKMSPPLEAASSSVLAFCLPDER